uniref:Uridine diphosphate glucose pyrophosphatase NUDT14 n=1 Tax=Elaeophora elaphi TaxID=1147741 RepID=A0A0R3RUD7_9BILA
MQSTETTVRMAGSEEFPTEVEIFEDVHDSQYVRPMRMKFKRGGKLIKWDFIVRHDSVACLLYHRQKQSLLFVKQFRPAVYLSEVRRLDENINKKWNEINWSKYPISMGETIELCAGIIDKPNITWKQHIQEEILEECGYMVNENEIESIKMFVTGVGSSGSRQELFYAEIDEIMKVSEGGGVDSEKIDKIFMTIPEAQKYCDQNEVASSPGMLYALMWFFKNRL